MKIFLFMPASELDNCITYINNIINDNTYSHDQISSQSS